jgi:Leucine-rich repeat (LRR) protein
MAFRNAYLNLSNNQLTDLPNSFLRLSSLEINLTDNHLPTEITDKFAHFEKLNI